MMAELTEEQEMLLRTIRQMAREKIAPRAAEVDETEEYPADFMELLRQSGLFSLMIPKEYGGAGGSITTLCLVVEEIAKVDGSAAMLFVNIAAVPGFLRLAGNSEQRARYFPELAQGKIMSVAVTEPDAGSDVSAIKTKAILQGDHYLLNGTKTFATCAKVADFIVTFAMAGSGESHGRLTGFVVDKGTRGVIIGRLENKLGLRAVPTGEVIFQDAPVPVSNRLGAEGDGFKAIWPAFNETRTVDGALAVGLAEGATDYAINYAKQRVQFGKPIAAFQAIQFMLADMATQTEAARCLVYEAASMVDRGEESATKFASMAKLFASDVAMKVTIDAIQVLGGYGYTKAYPVERMMRDAKALQIVEGTNQIQRLIIARNLLGRFD